MLVANATLENARPTPAAGSKRTLLIVDDEDAPRKSLELIFKHEYRILSAPDGPTAIRLAQENHIDVAVSDIRMAGMSGIEVLERLKFVDPGIEVVMLTAFETTDTIRQALKLRACDYLNKPFDVSAIRSAVSNAMQRRAMEGEITEDTGQLQSLIKELQQQKMDEQIAQTRGDIYASIIHDLRGPLTVIGGFVQLLGQRIGDKEVVEGEDLEFVRERLKTISRQVRNCSEISSRYLGFLRRQADEGPKVGVNQLLQDASNLLRVHPSRGSHDFEVVPVSVDVALRMNGTDFIQVMQNLVVNAFQCTQQKHTVRVCGRVIEAPLDLSAFKENTSERVINVENFKNEPPVLLLQISDTGPGIPTEIFPKIFQAYFTTKAAMQGTGLGLSIVQRLIKGANGILRVQSTPGEGTVFSVYIPAAKQG